MKKLVLAFAACAAAVVGFAKTITVTSTADTFPDAAEGSLRAALAEAEDGDTITFADELGPITIVGVNTAKADTSLVIDKVVTIEGNGATVDGGWNGGLKSDTGGRIFLIPSGVAGKVTIKDLTMKNGHGRGWGVANNAYFQGGAMCALSPVRCENCQFVNNCASDESAFNPTGRDGAIHSETDMELVDCLFDGDRAGNSNGMFGGVIMSEGGSLLVERATVTNCRSGSYGGGFLYGQDMSSLVLRDIVFDGVHANHTGGALWIKGCTTMLVERCRFAGCYAESSDGGAAVLEGTGHFAFRDCEFSDCSGGNGGAVRTEMTSGAFVNCTFHNCRNNQWGPTLDLRRPTCLVNCTIVGSLSPETDTRAAGAIFTSDTAARLLNTVMAFSYLNASVTPTLSDDVVPYNGSYTSVSSVLNGQVHGLSKDDVVAEIGLGSTELFEDALTTIESGSAVGNGGKKLAADVVIPTLADLGTYRSRVVTAKTEGPLDGTGYPVKVNADCTWIQYSADGGKSWTDLCKDGTPATSPELVTADQRGVEYFEGKTPIGAAGFAPDPKVPRFHLSATVSETDAKIAVQGVYIGEDASSYDVWASLDGGATEKVLEGQTAAAVFFEADNLSIGIHTSQVFVVNSANVTSRLASVSFRVVPPNTRIVTDLTDNVVSPAPGSLRAVLAETQDGETIVFDEPLRGKSITIVSVDSARCDTSIVIDKAVTIDGNGVTLDGGWAGASKDSTGGRIFLIPAGVGKVTIKNLTMKNGHGRGWNVANNTYFQGGAMCALSPVRFENCVFKKNTAADETAFAPALRGGGAIYAESDVEIVDCVFEDDSVLEGTSSYGGAICMKDGSLLIEGTAVTNCLSESYGGGFLYGQNLTSVTILDSTFYKVGAAKNEGGALWIKSCPTVEVEGCSFEETSGTQGGTFLLGRVGYADSACDNVVLRNCSFKNCSATSQGGLVYMQGGSLLVEGMTADACKCNNQASGVFGQNLASLVVRDSTFTADHSGGNGGVILVESSASDLIERCRFVDCYCGGQGGAILFNASALRSVVRDCEFTDCSAKCGAALRSHSNPTIILNCTFTGCSIEGDAWGPAFDSRGVDYCINCTFSGNMYLDSQCAGKGGFAVCKYGTSLTFLNCVGAFNYGYAKAIETHDLETDKDFYTGGGIAFYNTIYNGKASDGTTALAADAPLFTAYEDRASASYWGGQIALKDGVKVPTFSVDEKGKFRSCVIGIEKDGLLDGTGWPVKVNADYTHICYSSDGGTTWTDLYKSGTPDDSTLELITKDQRGVAYYKGKTPIGAATIEPTAGMYLIIR